MDDYPTRIDICDGKYTIIYDFNTGKSEALRYGEKWRDLCGDTMVLAMFDTIVELRERAGGKEEIARLNEGWSEANSTILDRDVEIVGLKDYINQLEVFRNMLSGLVYHLLRNYEDDMWSSSTRELLEKANDYIGNQPIVWNIDDESKG